MESTPTTAPSSVTGRWRMWLSVMMRRHSPTVCLRETEITGLLMISATFVSFDKRPCSTTLRA